MFKFIDGSEHSFLESSPVTDEGPAGARLQISRGIDLLVLSEGTAASGNEIVSTSLGFSLLQIRWPSYTTQFIFIGDEVCKLKCP